LGYSPVDLSSWAVAELFHGKRIGEISSPGKNVGPALVFLYRVIITDK
jgi:hypothetical protein